MTLKASLRALGATVREVGGQFVVSVGTTEPAWWLWTSGEASAPLLLTVAQALMEQGISTAALIFAPERASAATLLKAGLSVPPQAVGIHLRRGTPAGLLLLRPGPMTACFADYQILLAGARGAGLLKAFSCLVDELDALGVSGAGGFVQRMGSRLGGPGATGQGILSVRLGALDDAELARRESELCALVQACASAHLVSGELRLVTRWPAALSSPILVERALKGASLLRIEHRLLEEPLRTPDGFAPLSVRCPGLTLAIGAGAHGLSDAQQAALAAFLCWMVKEVA